MNISKNTFNYSNPLIDGHYFINGPNHLDENYNQILLATDISEVFPSNGFNIIYNDGSIDIIFDNNLTPDEQTLLDTTVNNHKNYKRTKIQNIYQDWQNTYSDYKSARLDMALEVAINGFYNLPLLEQRMASRWFVVDSRARNSVYSLEEQVEHGKTFHVNSIAARDKRLQALSLEIYNRFQKSEINILINDAGLLTYNYINFGKEGTLEGDGEGLFDYICARAGTSYENNGLAVKEYIPSGMTMNELVDRCMKILKNGIYP